MTTAKEWRVKFDGPCGRCGRVLTKGTMAIWNRSTGRMQCVQCPGEGAVGIAGIDAGVGGASARREHHRRVAKRELETRARWGERLGGVVLKLTNEPQSIRAWRIGAEGEEKLASALAEVDGLRVLNDRRVPGTPANIDHIVVAPAGVFVVDAKNYRGTVQIRDRGSFLRRVGRLYVGNWDRSADAAAVNRQVDTVMRATASAGSELIRPIPVLCFIDADWPLIRRPRTYMGVALENVQTLRERLTATDVLAADVIGRVTQVLAAALPSKTR